MKEYVGKLVVICCIAVLLTGCPGDFLFSFRIINQSDANIVWVLRLGQWGDIEQAASDPWYGRYDKFLVYSGMTFVDQLDFYKIKSNLEKGWIKYYLFNLDSIKTIPWQRICDERIILKEVTFNSWDDFERCNFEIVYP